MRTSFEQLSLKNLRGFLQVSVLTNVGLIIVVILLAIQVIRQDTRIILMPQYDLTRKLSVSRAHVSNAYIKDWSQGILNQLLNVSPETVSTNFKQVLRLVSPQHAGCVREYWEKEVSRIQRSKVSTVFYPQEFVISHTSKSLEVRGVLHSWFANDHKPVVETKSFTMVWEHHPSGLILLAGVTQTKEPSS